MPAKSVWAFSVAAIALGMLSDAACAQSTGESEATPDVHLRGAVDAGMGDLVVTARKRAEALQDVPIAVSALDAARLEVRGFDNIQDVSFSMPNVALDSVGSSPSSASFAIRGLGGTSSVQSLEPGVGTFVDGAYLAVNAGIVSDTFDVDSVEVLRGPQGTLFGRNVTGGAVLINTKKPSQTFGGEVLVRADTGLDAPADAEYVVGAAITGPITPTLSARLAGYYKKDHGYGHNRAVDLDPTINGGDHSNPDSETWFVRPSVLWEPTDTVSMLLRFEHFEHDGNAVPIQNWANFKRGTFDFANNYAGHSRTRVNNVTAQFDFEVGPGTITNLFNYRNLKDAFSFDTDGTVNTIQHASVYTGSKQVSNELRYAGTVGILDFTVGAFAYEADLDAVESRQLSAGIISGGGKQNTKSFALFTENQVHITDRLTAIFGLRYTAEKKRADITQITLAAKCGAIFPARKSDCIVDSSGRKSWDLFGFKLGGQYKFNDDVMAYATFTRGFRSGGFNVRQVLPIDPIPFDEERLDAYEVGVKATWWGGRARTNIALYSNDVKDFQRTVQLSIPVNPFTVQTTSNAADARFRGFEIEQSFKLTDRLLISGYVGHIDGKYTALAFDVNGDRVINDLDFALKPTRVPRYSYGGQISFDQPVGDHLLSAVVSIDHRDHNFFSDDNRGKIPGVDMLNARLALAMTNGLTLAVFGNNLLNDAVYGGATPLGPLFDGSGRFPTFTYPELGATPVGTLSPIVQRPRTIGAELRFNF